MQYNCWQHAKQIMYVEVYDITLKYKINLGLQIYYSVFILKTIQIILHFCITCHSSSFLITEDPVDIVVFYITIHSYFLEIKIEIKIMCQ